MNSREEYTKEEGLPWRFRDPSISALVLVFENAYVLWLEMKVKFSNSIAVQKMLKRALWKIIDECPDPKLPYGSAVVDIAKEALGKLVTQENLDPDKTALAVAEQLVGRVVASQKESGTRKELLTTIAEEIQIYKESS